MISLFKYKDKKDKPVDYSKDPKYKGWEKVYKGAGEDTAKQGVSDDEHKKYKQFYEQKIKGDK